MIPLHAALPTPSPGHMPPMGGEGEDGIAACAEGPPEWMEIPQSVIWQSRTQFSSVAQPWVSYSAEISERLERARCRGTDSVDVSFEGHDFRIDMSALTQTRVGDPSKVREVRRVLDSRQQWYCVSSTSEADPCAFAASANRMIEEGTGQRVMMHGALCHKVMSDGPRYIDKTRGRQYTSEDDPRYRRLLSVPDTIHRVVGGGTGARIRRGAVPAGCSTYKRIQTVFNASKADKVQLTGVRFVLNPLLFLQWQEKVQSMGDSARVCLVFHGTAERNVEPITSSNFSLQRVGSNSGNEGWFGKGVYFARHSRTACGYGGENRTVLACLVAVQKVFQCPPPESAENPYHGKDCKAGYDAHLSHVRKELVIFNPKQILPCFILELDGLRSLPSDPDY